jgi:hypothetical protein
MNDINPDCRHFACSEDDSTLEYVAHYAAPGIGYSARCTICLASFSVVGGSVYNPNEMAHVLGPEDVI